MKQHPSPFSVKEFTGRQLLKSSVPGNGPFLYEAHHLDKTATLKIIEFSPRLGVLSVLHMSQAVIVLLVHNVFSINNQSKHYYKVGSKVLVSF